MQQWVNIDRRGNWLDFRESIAGVGQRRETRQANGVNEYAAIDLDDPKPAVFPDNTAPSATPAYDPAGNLWFSPWAKALDQARAQALEETAALEGDARIAEREIGRIHAEIAKGATPTPIDLGFLIREPARSSTASWPIALVTSRRGWTPRKACRTTPR
jgi:hypothetical protein